MLHLPAGSNKSRSLASGLQKRTSRGPPPSCLERFIHLAPFVRGYPNGVSTYSWPEVQIE